MYNSKNLPNTNFRNIERKKKMKQPPYELTPKDCQYIEDILNHSLSLVKKTNLCYEMSQDQDVKDLLEDINVLLTAQYEDLINLMEGEEQ